MTQDEMRRVVAAAQRKVLADRRLSKAGRLVVHRLLGYVQTNPKHRYFGVAWPAQSSLARETGYSDRTVRRALSSLPEGFFEVRKTRVGYGCNNQSTYRPDFMAILAVPDESKPDISEPAAVEPEPEKRDILAIQTGQNVQVSCTNDPKLKETPPCPPEGANVESASLGEIIEPGIPAEPKPVDTLTQDETEAALVDYERRRHLRDDRGPYTKTALRARLKALITEGIDAATAAACAHLGEQRASPTTEPSAWQGNRPGDEGLSPIPSTQLAMARQLEQERAGQGFAFIAGMGTRLGRNYDLSPLQAIAEARVAA